MADAGRQLNTFTGNLRRLVGEDAVRRQVMDALGKEAIRLIVVRTRLGYTSRRTTVRSELGKIKNVRERLKPHDERFINAGEKGSYTEYRRRYSDYLSQFTKVRRSNLTFSGQLLQSIGIKRVTARQVIISPDNKFHVDVVSGEIEGFTNEDLGEYVTAAGRPFLELSSLDDKKLVRFYRRQFGDLLKRFGKVNK